MKRLPKIMLLAGGAVILLAVIGLAIFIATFDANQYKDTLIALVEGETGRDFNIEGELHLAPSLLPTVVVEGVSFGNADWGTDPHMVSVDRLEARIGLLPLLRGEILISRLILNAPIINLEIGPDGRGNWQLGEVAIDKETATEFDLPALDIHEMLIDQAVISYRAIAAETSQQFNIQRLGIHTDGMGQPLKFELRARYQDHALRATGELDPLDIEPGQYRLTQLDARLGESDVSGTVSMRIENNRPQISADLKSGHLDTRPFQSEKPDKKQKTERIFSTRTFDLAGLRTVDADITIQADRVTTRDALLEALTAKVVLHQGKLHIQPLTARLAGGQMSGDIALDASGQIPTLNARLELENVLPGELPTLKQKNLIREGRTNVRFTGRGAGDSAAAIAGSLNGQLLVETGRGQLLSQATDLAGGDLLFSAFQMLNPLAERESTSQLICGVLNFDIKDGTATADKGIALQTDKVNVLGSGIIDLKTEALDIRVSPKAREGIGVGLGTISDTVYIAGTLANPTPAADARSALRAAGTIGGAIATGGLSLLARGLFDRTFSASDPCAVALGRAEAGSKSSAAEEDKSTIEKATDEVRGMFRGLFDR